MTNGQKTTLALVMLFAAAAYARNKLQKIETHSGASPGVVTIKGDDFQVATGGSNGECLVWDTSADAGVSWGSCGGTLGDGDYGDILVDGGVWDLQANTVGDGELNAGSATDEYCLTFETDGGVLEWQVCGGGDSVLVDSSATVDPDFQDGDVDFTYAAGVVTATVGCSGCVDATDLGADSLTPADLNTVAAAGAPEDEYCLTYEHSTTEFAWQVCSAGGGDSITVNSGATVDPNFLNGDIDWTYSGTDITATVGCSGCVDATDLAANSLTPADLDAVGAAGVSEDEYCLTYEHGTTEFAWQNCHDDVTCTGCVDTGDVLNGSIAHGDLDTVSGAVAGNDEHCLTYEHSTGELEWQACGGGVSDGDKGDITVSGSGTTWNIDASTIGTSEITDYSIATVDIVPGAVDNTLLAGDAVTSSRILNSSVGEVDLNMGNATTDEHCMTWEDATSEMMWQDCSPDSSIDPSDLDATDSPASNEIPVYASSTRVTWKNICELAYPVGSIYISVNSTNPGTSLGCGTWSAFGAGRALVGLDSGRGAFDADEETGGSWDHDHDYTQVPNHKHPYASQTATTGAISSYEHGAIDTSSAATETTITTENPTGGVTTGTTGTQQASGGAADEPIEYITVRLWKRTA